MKQLLMGAMALVVVAASAAAQESKQPRFADRVLESVLPIDRASDGSLSGPGWDRLIEEANAAQFFLVGENHATADIAFVEARLQAALAHRNYDYMAVEIGPWSTRYAEETIRHGLGALEQFVASPGNQFTLPFLFFREEIALVEQAVALSPRQSQVLWGVDQEFLGAAGLLIRDLRRVAQSAEQLAAVEHFAAASQRNPMFLGAAPDSEIAALQTAFADGSPEARQLVADIQLTHRIYGPFMRQTGPIYQANLERENHMKTNFLEHFARAEERDGKPPKVFFKFGGFHMERGLSGTNVPSFGNFIMEWGRARGFRSVHLMIDCLGGQAFAIMAGKSEPCDSYALKDGSPLLAAADGREIALIDLAALRPYVTSRTELDEQTKDLILSFDYFLIIRNVKPATPVADLTLPSM